MQKLIDFYEGEAQRYDLEHNGVKRRLSGLSVWRMVVFVLTAVLAYIFFPQNSAWAVLIVGLGVFLFLVRRYAELKGERDLLAELTSISKTEIEVLQHRFEQLPSGEEFNDPEHAYSQDLDLFGKGSFFQYLNRTALKEGQEKLVKLMVSNNIEAIAAKQETIDELSQKPQWRHGFLAKSRLLKTETNVDTVVAWLAKYTPFVPQRMRSLPWVFLFISIALVIASLWMPAFQWIFVAWMATGLILTGRFAKKIAKLASNAGKIQPVFESYAELMKIIEDTDFEAAQLRLQKQQLMVGGTVASGAIGKFSRLLNQMDYNNNVFYAIFGNGCFLGALKTAYEIEKWIDQHRGMVAQWFKVIAFFDAWNSLGNFAFNHPLYAYPIVQNGPTILASKDAGHPLITEKRNVLNDIEIRDEEFFIVTGANMAGKSTFLRTVGLQIVMANMGLPVCASECIYSPIKLITSMRTTDSLTKGASYFFSELKRLKFIIDTLKNERHFVVLDEILKGTNSADKATGSRQFLERLLHMYATGIIATHDLGLCEAETVFEQVHNYYFDAEIHEGELHFDYQLKKGICQNMNASFLLKSMGIVG